MFKAIKLTDSCLAKMIAKVTSIFCSWITFYNGSLKDKCYISVIYEGFEKQSLFVKVSGIFLSSKLTVMTGVYRSALQFCHIKDNHTMK